MGGLGGGGGGGGGLGDLLKNPMISRIVAECRQQRESARSDVFMLRVILQAGHWAVEM